MSANHQHRLQVYVYVWFTCVDVRIFLYDLNLNLNPAHKSLHSLSLTFRVNIFSHFILFYFILFTNANYKATYSYIVHVTKEKNKTVETNLVYLTHF